MAEQSPLRLIKQCTEYIPSDEFLQLKRGIRGIYVLYRFRPRLDKFDVVYVGMTNAWKGGGIRGRLKGHKKEKAGLWTHCSVFEVWDNIRDEEIVELEGLFRHIYRHDSKANELNVQKGFKKLTTVNLELDQWE